MSIDLFGFDWTRDRVTVITIQRYRDGIGLWLGGRGIPANIVVQASEDDIDKETLSVIFPNLEIINMRISNAESDYSGSGEGDEDVRYSEGNAAD